MINLLPEQYKKELNRDYQFRRLAVILLFGFLLTLCVAVLLAPSYVLSLYRLQGVSTKAVTLQTSQGGTSDAELKRKIADAKALLETLRPEAYTTPSRIIDLLVKDKTADNIITDISYARSGSSVSVIVRGLAKTRKGLVAFVDQLNHESAIDKVDIPISHFAKDTDIGFMFTITAAKQR